VACNNDVTDKLDNNAVGSEELAVNIKRIRQLTKDLKATTDCDALKMKLGITGDELKELTKDVRAEAKKILEKYLPIASIPTNPLKIIPWVKKLVTGTIMPQLEAYIKLLQQIIGIIQATQELIQAAGEVLPKIEQCARDTVQEELDKAEGYIKDEVKKIKKQIKDAINDAICQSGIGDLKDAINDSVKLTKDLIKEVNDTIDIANDAIDNTLASVQSIGDTVSNLTGVTFSVNTSSASAFTTSIAAGSFETFKTDTQAFLDIAPAVNTVAPSITGTAQVGSTLTANVGTWTGATVTHTYQWYRGDEPINGANSSTYVVGGDDLNFAITCKVDGGNVAGGDTIPTPATAAVTPGGVDPLAPTITGTAQVGQIVEVSGAWSKYQWQWAHVSANIYGAVASAYTINVEDLGRTLTCIVTDANNNTRRCTPTNIVVGNVAITGTLTVSGNTTLSNTLTVTGNTTLSNTLIVTGNTTLSNTLAVTGATTLSNTLAVTGSITSNEQITANNDGTAIALTTHLHGGVTTGTANTGTPV
jgi:hypothetical protein